jgi:hypothetical protein
VAVIPEKDLVGLLDNCLRLSSKALAEFQNGDVKEPASLELVEEFSGFIKALHDEKKHDSVLADQSWEWIWKVTKDMKAIQIYGRLAWVNYNLVDFL